MSTRVGLEIEPVISALTATADAEIVLLATSSGAPVVSLNDLAADVHVSTVGPKLKGYCELGTDVVEAAQLVATDSPQQIEAYAKRYFLQDKVHGAGSPISEQSMPGPMVCGARCSCLQAWPGQRCSSRRHAESAHAADSIIR